MTTELHHIYFALLALMVALLTGRECFKKAMEARRKKKAEKRKEREVNILDTLAEEIQRPVV